MDQVGKNDEIHRLRSRYIPQGQSSLHPRYVASASGAVIRDVEGREYIDFAGGIGVMNIGRCHPRVVAAIPADGLKSLGR
jgi:4-aminobutyrate aminotransferase/(S)-3-amino-2-methylpropionate transaminase